MSPAGPGQVRQPGGDVQPGHVVAVAPDVAGEQPDPVDDLGDRPLGVAGRRERVHGPRPEGGHVPDGADGLAPGGVGVRRAQQHDQPAGDQDPSQRDDRRQAVQPAEQVPGVAGWPGVDRREDLGGDDREHAHADGQRHDIRGPVGEQRARPGLGDRAAVLRVAVVVAAALGGARRRVVGGRHGGGAVRRRGLEAAVIPAVPAPQQHRGHRGADEQADRCGPECVDRPRHGQRAGRRGIEDESAGHGRAEEPGHAEVDHHGQQAAEQQAQQRDQGSEATARYGGTVS